MQLKFNGPAIIRRTVGEVEWSRENGFLAEVPVDLAADLIGSPGNEFAIMQAKQDELDEMALQFGVPVEALKKYLAVGAVIQPKRKSKRAKEAHDDD